MKCCPQLSALLRRGLIGKTESWKGSLLELALPIVRRVGMARGRERDREGLGMR